MSNRSLRGYGSGVSWLKVVFVHGALVYDGAWWWSRMVEPLAVLGLDSRAVELPSCVASTGTTRDAMGDMYDDADAVRDVLDEEEGPVVLVGHSYGGMVITDAAAGQENVEHLDYVTSVMPGCSLKRPLHRMPETSCSLSWPH